MFPSQSHHCCCSLWLRRWIESWASVWLNQSEWKEGAERKRDISIIFSHYISQWATHLAAFRLVWLAAVVHLAPSSRMLHSEMVVPLLLCTFVTLSDFCGRRSHRRLQRLDVNTVFRRQYTNESETMNRDCCHVFSLFDPHLSSCFCAPTPFLFHS